MIFELNNGPDNKIGKTTKIYRFTTKKNKIDSNCKKFQIGNTDFVNSYFKNNTNIIKMDVNKKKEIF